MLLIAGFFPKAEILWALFEDSPLLHCKRKEFVFRSRFKGRVPLPFFSSHTFYLRASRTYLSEKWFGILLVFTLHGRLGIRNFSSCVEKYFLTLEEKFRISSRPCNILYIKNIACNFFNEHIYFIKSKFRYNSAVLGPENRHKSIF